MKLLLISLIAMLACAPKGKEEEATPQPHIYSYKVEGLSGGTIDFSAYKGKKILIVNTASECGYTPQYEGLETLYKKHSDKLVIVGFPSNDFGTQEPGSNKDIEEFCQKNFGVTFPMAAKVAVKGAEQTPIYQWLTKKSLNGFKDSEVGWNFHKYAIDEQGHLVAVWPSKVTPMGTEIAEWLGE